MQAAPPTRQLYIRFHGPPNSYPRTEGDIERIFTPFGRVKKVHLLPKGDAAMVHFSQTREARQAKQNMHEHAVHNISFFVYFGKSSRLLFFDYYPLALGEEAVRNLITKQFSRFGELERVDVLHKKLFVLFHKEEDAVRAVLELQNHREGEWIWEIEFHKVRWGPRDRRAIDDLLPLIVATLLYRSRDRIALVSHTATASVASGARLAVAAAVPPEAAHLTGINLAQAGSLLQLGSAARAAVPNTAMDSTRHQQRRREAPSLTRLPINISITTRRSTLALRHRLPPAVRMQPAMATAWSTMRTRSGARPAPVQH
jgi:hypothetical protein